MSVTTTARNTRKNNTNVTSVIDSKDAVNTLQSIERFRAEGRRYKGNIWVYEVKDDGRWIPDGSNIFFTRDEAREFVMPLRATGLDVRIAKYEMVGQDRF
jgi:hypothetical protein